jgi:hypothetical protein
MPMDDASFDANQEMGGEEQMPMDDTMSMQGDMGEMPQENTATDSTMEIINQLSDKDKKTVEAYAESLLSKDENQTNDNEEETLPDGLNMEQPMNESFIFTKKQLTKLMENK